MLNDGELRALLIRLDDSERAEAPAVWDRPAAEARFVALATTLEQRLGYPCPYETGFLIQDANFHGQLFLPREILIREETVSLRASNFDRLAAICDDEAVVQPQALATIVATLTEHGYTYVPRGVLMAGYSGKNSGVDGFTTWMRRFFDWV